MPNIAEKSKVFGGKGVVLSFTRAPDVFLYRELIPGIKKYRYKVIDGTNTLFSREPSVKKTQRST